MKKNYLFGLTFFFGLSAAVNSQSISAESVEYQILKVPKIIVAQDFRQFSVAVTSPYNLTTEAVVAQSKTDFENDLTSFDKRVADSQKDFQQILVDYDAEVLKAKEKYKMESEEFKKLSLLERLTMTDKGQNPKLVLPNKPVYVPLSKPVYHEPNLKNFVIIDNNVLASQIDIKGFSKEGNYLTISLDIKKINFQDNSGQSYANQPTTLVVKQNGEEKINKTFFQDYEYISSSPTNNINKATVEQVNVKKVMAFINSYLNETFAFQSLKNTVKLQSVKNKGQYDDLEKADIYVSTNLKKLNPSNPQINEAAMAGMQKGIDIWKEVLKKIDYKDTKADYNAKIAKFVYFNLINLNLALDKKSDAEKFLNEMQENLIYIKLSSSEEGELKQIENKIYKTT
jgi:septum formation inhibitor MinC